MVTIQVTLDESLAKEANRLGLLTNEKITEAIESQVQQQKAAAWKRLDAKLELLRASFREQYGHLSEDEALAMIDRWIEEPDAETPGEQNP